MSPVSECGVSPAAAQCPLCLAGAASSAWLLLPINTPPHQRRQPGPRRHGRRGARAQAPGQLARGQQPGDPSFRSSRGGIQCPGQAVCGVEVSNFGIEVCTSLQYKQYSEKSTN